MANAHKSFIREILKVTANPEVISFAGGLPNPQLFPVKELADATAKVMAEDGDSEVSDDAVAPAADDANAGEEGNPESAEGAVQGV